MAHVVLLKGVNVGGHRTFRPSQLAADLKHLDVVSIGAAGTFIVRRRATAAQLRAEFGCRLPFAASIVVCRGSDLVRLLSRAVPLDKDPPAPKAVRYVSVLAARPRTAPRVPATYPASGRWLLKILSIDGRFVIGVYRRHMKVIEYLSRFDRLFGVPATTRNWKTMMMVVEALGYEADGQRPSGTHSSATASTHSTRGARS